MAFIVITIWAAVVEIPFLSKQGLTREIWVFSFLLLLGSGVNLAHMLRIPLKNPVEWVFACYRPVSDFFLQYLQ